MKQYNFQDEQSWLDARTGKITGSRLKDVITLRGTGKKIGYYELIAERLALPRNSENPMDRGHRLEPEALAIFQEKTGKQVNTDLVLWTREDDESIAVSPDGYIGETEAVEVKCLASARHIEALLTNEIPSEYEFQVLQYFIVNDKLEKLYFVFYDPSLSCKQFFYREITRESVAGDVEKYLEAQRQILEEVKSIVKELSF